jgi:hypothetical protein
MTLFFVAFLYGNTIEKGKDKEKVSSYIGVLFLGRLQSGGMPRLEVLLLVWFGYIYHLFSFPAQKQATTASRNG